MLTPYEAIELQQKLIILYKFVLQKKLYDKFYLRDSLAIYKKINCKDNDNKNIILDNVVQEILSMENCKKFLEECLIELEEIRPPTFDRDYGITIEYITSRRSIEYLAKSHGLKDSDDIFNLEIENLIKLL